MLVSVEGNSHHHYIQLFDLFKLAKHRLKKALNQFKCLKLHHYHLSGQSFFLPDVSDAVNIELDFLKTVKILTLLKS